MKKKKADIYLLRSSLSTLASVATTPTASFTNAKFDVWELDLIQQNMLAAEFSFFNICSAVSSSVWNAPFPFSNEITLAEWYLPRLTKNIISQKMLENGDRKCLTRLKRHLYKLQCSTDTLDWRRVWCPIHVITFNHFHILNEYWCYLSVSDVCVCVSLLMNNDVILYWVV